MGQLITGYRAPINEPAVSGLIQAMETRYSNLVTLNDNYSPNTVAIIGDSSANSYDFYQTIGDKQPEYWQGEAPYPGLYFNGESTYTSLASWIKADSAAGNDLADNISIYMVLRWPKEKTGIAWPTTIRDLLRKYNNTGGLGWKIEQSASTGKLSIYVMGNGGTSKRLDFSDTDFEDGKARVICATMAAGTIYTYVNDAEGDTDTYGHGTGLATGQPIVMGARDNGNTAAEMVVYAERLYNVVHNSTDRNAVMNFLKSVYEVNY